MSLHLYAQNGWIKQEPLSPLPPVCSEAIQQGSETQEWIKLKKEHFQRLRKVKLGTGWKEQVLGLNETYN